MCAPSSPVREREIKREREREIKREREREREGEREGERKLHVRASLSFFLSLSL